MNDGLLTLRHSPPWMPRTILGKPTPILMPGSNYVYDADVTDYIRRVESADNAPLEQVVKVAIDTLVSNLKNSGVWNLLRLMHLFCGARTLTGCLVPLIGPTCAAYNFVSGDYNRRTGLLGNSTNKYLLAGISGASLPPTSHHMFLRGSSFPTSGGTLIVFGSSSGADSGLFDFLMHFNGNRLGRSTINSVGYPLNANGSVALVRQNASLSVSFSDGLRWGINQVQTSPSFSSNPLGIYTRNDGVNNPVTYVPCRLNVFTLGSSLTDGEVLMLHLATQQYTTTLQNSL